ncbi:hypothetical protein [Maridesulfovibrio sp.]|nr:hypothetical protein [Maridesulfovibrio sp.]
MTSFQIKQMLQFRFLRNATGGQKGVKRLFWLGMHDELKEMNRV